VIGSALRIERLDPRSVLGLCPQKKTRAQKTTTACAPRTTRHTHVRPGTALGYLSIYPSIYPSIHLSIYPSIYPSIYLSIHPSIYLSIYLSIFLYKYIIIIINTHTHSR
jgi:hypothetical protein